MPPPASSSAAKRSFPVSRPPLQRMVQIHARLQSCSYPNCRKLAQFLEVSPKTIQRDFDFMRDRLNLPLAYDAVKNGFFYTEPVASFPCMDVSEGELVALFVAQKALSLYPGTAFQAQLAAAFRKITDALQETISFTWSDLDGAISFSRIGTTAPELACFQEISCAVLQCRELSLEYHKIRGARHERRRIRPYHLGCVKNQWYVIGYDLERAALRTFALPRMRKARMLATHFERPPEFSVGAHLRQSFGVVTGAGPAVTVRLRFDAFAARMVAERHWHASQQLKELADGGLELSLELGSLDEIKRWILSWGAHVRVLAPPSLVKIIRDTAAKVAKQHGAPVRGR